MMALTLYDNCVVELVMRKESLNVPYVVIGLQIIVIAKIASRSENNLLKKKDKQLLMLILQM